MSNSNYPYRPDYDGLIVANLRAELKSESISTEKLTDGQVYDLFMDAFFTENPDAELRVLVKEFNESN